jgi:hypothetical protein
MSQGIVAALAAALIGGSPADHVAQTQPDPIACYTVGDLYRFSNAQDTGDKDAARALLRGHCVVLSPLSYTPIEEKNGVVRIHVFPQPGDHEDWRTMFTLRDMLPSG